MIKPIHTYQHGDILLEIEIVSVGSMHLGGDTFIVQPHLQGAQIL
jgi:hypothetical protein